MVCADFSTEFNAALNIDQYPLPRFEDAFETLNGKTLVVDLETEVDRLQAENKWLKHTLGEVCGEVVYDQLTNELPDNFLEQFNQLPDRPLEHVLRFLPAHQVPQLRYVSRRFNHLIKKCSKTMPQKECKGSVVFEINLTGQLTVEWIDDRAIQITKKTFTDDEVALSELLRFMRIGGRMYFGHGLSATDEVLDQLCKAWVTIRPEMVIFSGDLLETSRDSLRAFLGKVEPTIERLHFHNACNIADSLLSDDVIGAAGRLDGLVIKPVYYGSELPNFSIGDKTLLAMVDADHVPSSLYFMGCSGITPGGIRAFVEKWINKWMKKEKPKAGANSTGYRHRPEYDWCKLTLYKCANVTPAAVEEVCGDLLKKNSSMVVPNRAMNDRPWYTTRCRSNKHRLDILFYTYSMAALEAEVARLQAENERLRRALADIDEQIVCGKSTGRLPDNFPKQFSQLPDRPLEQVLRFLPAHQVVQIRLVSRRFNNVIKKCSNTMPKKECNGTVMFEINLTGQFTVDWFDDSGRKIMTTQLASGEVPLSELLRFICIGGSMHFSHGLSAADEVLDQLCKACVTIRPKKVIFGGNLSHTSRDSLRAFLVKVEPFVKELLFRDAFNIADSLLSDDVIDAAGRLEGLMIKPVCWGSELPNFNIGDNTLLAMADADHMPWYFRVMGCSGITPNGIRAFIQKWMKKGGPKAGANSAGDRYEDKLDWRTLTFYKCANMTPAAVEEACGDLVMKKTIVSVYREKMNDPILYSINCNSRNRRLEIRFNSDRFFSRLVTKSISGVVPDVILPKLFVDSSGSDAKIDNEDDA
uniref:F-box domain-containing protein n=1 Tax=Plectus sambesii TaxID=2011161 RepID=A0A914VHI8_9BILA